MNIAAITESGRQIIVENYVKKTEVEKSIAWWKENGMSNVQYKAIPTTRGELMKRDWSFEC